MTNLEERKKKALLAVSTFTPDLNVDIDRTQKVIHTGIEDLSYVNMKFHSFLTDLKANTVFGEEFADSVAPSVVNFLSRIEYLLKKDYTIEELDSMTMEAYEQTRQSQQKRAKLLKDIMKKYNL